MYGSAKKELCCSSRHALYCYGIQSACACSQSCEMLCIKDVSTSQHWVLIYRTRHDIPVAETRQLHDAIEALITLYPKTVILGDLNYRVVDWICKDSPAALDAISYEFIELCASCDFTQIVNRPITFDMCLDFILTPDPENVLAVDVHLLVLHRKDHNLVECKWKFRTTESKLGIPRRKFSRADYIGISNALCAMDWKAMFSGCRTINEYWLTLYHILQQLIYDYVPLTVFHRHVTNRRHLPKDVRATILRKRKAWKRWQRASYKNNKVTYDTVSCDRSHTLDRNKAAEEESLLRQNNRCFFNYVSKSLHPNFSGIVLNDGDTSLSTP